MGMDARIIRCRNVLQPESTNFWEICRTINEGTYDDLKAPAIVWEARKWYDMHNFIVSLLPGKEYESGEYVALTKQQLETILAYATHHTDYWCGFGSVPNLCRALLNYDDVIENGYIYVYECDW